MTREKEVYLVIDWQEHSPRKNTYPFWRNERKVFTSSEYPTRLPCNNPDCTNGGFEIGDKIATLLSSSQDSEQNSLICHNAIHPDRTKRCLHVITYSMTCIRPFWRGGESHPHQQQASLLVGKQV